MQDAEGVRRAREGAHQEYYSQFTYQPHINPRSQQLAQVGRQWPRPLLNALAPMRQHSAEAGC